MGYLFAKKQAIGYDRLVNKEAPHQSKLIRLLYPSLFTAASLFLANNALQSIRPYKTRIPIAECHLDRMKVLSEQKLTELYLERLTNYFVIFHEPHQIHLDRSLEIRIDHPGNRRSSRISESSETLFKRTNKTIPDFLFQSLPIVLEHFHLPTEFYVEVGRGPINDRKKAQLAVMNDANLPCVQLDTHALDKAVKISDDYQLITTLFGPLMHQG